MSGEISIRRAEPTDVRLIDGLTDVLLDCVEGGASIGFMLPLERQKVEAFWAGQLDSAWRGERILLIAEDETGTIVGTVQVVFAVMENQPHRGEISKMLVHRQARRRGIGEALMQSAEAAARAAGKTLLVLDTASDDAVRLYDRLDWHRAGVIPDFALWPDGRPVDTIVFYKKLTD